MPFNLDDVIHRRRIEDNRVEFKATWDDFIKVAVVTRTVCAFANDLLNLNGGYILLGNRRRGRAAGPSCPREGSMASTLIWFKKRSTALARGFNPPYPADSCFPVEYQGRMVILLIWAPAGDTRPYQRARRNAKAKGSPLAMVSFAKGPMTVAARGGGASPAYGKRGSRTPFDDRRNLQARLEDLSPALVRRFLHEIKSDLIDADPPVSDYESVREACG